jgi:hypothetical protein
MAQSAEHRVAGSGLTFQTVAPRLRNAVLSRGFFRILSTLPMTAQFRALSADNRVSSLKYLRWCRDLFLVFARYGTSRSCTMLESAEILDTLRDGVWHQGQLFEAWHELQRHLAADIHFEHPGWLRPTVANRSADDVKMSEPEGGNLATEDVDTGRAERIRLFSLDGTTDPRNDRTSHDYDYGALHDLAGFEPAFLPSGDISSGQMAIKNELTTQQQTLRELEGTQPFLPGLPGLQ